MRPGWTEMPMRPQRGKPRKKSDRRTSIDDRKEILERARQVEESFKVRPQLYLVGSLEKGLTVYGQQVRAHNLVWALWELLRPEHDSPRRIAVVGGGIAGLTAVACALSRMKQARITLFERFWDLCPLQQGSDSRWLNPRIYEWPEYGSRVPGASLPVLNWTEGRASDVARDILRQFSLYCERHDESHDRLRVYLGLTHLRITAANNRIEWMGSRAAEPGPSFRAGSGEGGDDAFDTIILAPGFGLEKTPADFPTPSYWRNEQRGQPVLSGTRQSYMISGYGDSALVDLFRLTIGRFRQDTILYELFDGQLGEFEETLRKARSSMKVGQNDLDLFRRLPRDEMNDAQTRLARRIRMDTTVVMHLAGKNALISSLRQVFDGPSSLLNKLLFYFLYKCGAFTTSYHEFKDAIAHYKIPHENVICRHGTDAMTHILELFVDPDAVKERLESMKSHPMQTRERLWVPGCFPHHSQ